MAPVRLDPPERLVRAVVSREGGAGLPWLESLPGLVREYLERWELEPERVQAPGGRTGMVVLVRLADGGQAALKVCRVTPETALEHRALEHWDGRGAVRLLRCDPAAGALLLERLRGDVTLRSLPEPKALLEAAGVLQRLWTPLEEGHPFTSVADRTAEGAEELAARRGQPWAEEVGGLVDEALRTRSSLLSEPAEEVLLHGDFHQGNVLAGSRAPWLAIGPEPLAGERAYDLARLARDRLDTLAAAPGPRAEVRRRITKLAASLDVAPERLRGWALWRSVEAGMRSLAAGDREDGELLLEFASRL
ncbi:aminoglycoside phosphotransferase family protein [Streptomyces thermolineatus]|uniref:Aminoglycoside phosphotransferase family protein n=1 Tax=Streptomyces thermolineatus TaxID=44033 RepID=A0ABP5Z3X7_9ACTN